MLSTSVIDRILARAGLVSGLSSAEVQRRLEAGVKDEDLSKRRVSFYLLEMEEGELYSDPGYPSTLDYATRRLKLDERRARERMWLGRQLRGLPLIDAFFCSDLLSSSARGWGWSKLAGLVYRVPGPAGCGHRWIARSVHGHVAHGRTPEGAVQSLGAGLRALAQAAEQP